MVGENTDNPPKEVKSIITPSDALTPETKVEAKSGNNIVVPFSHGNNGDDDDGDDEGSTTTRVRTVSAQLYVRHEHDNHNNYDDYDNHDDHDDQWKELASCCTPEKEGKDDEEEEKKRLKFNCTQSLDACSLWLENVTREDAGFYRCHFRTDAVERNTTVRLIVLDPDEFSPSGYMMSIYIGISATGFLLLSVFLVLLARYSRTTRNRPILLLLFLPLQLSNQQRVASDANDYENFPSYQRPSGTPNIPVYGNVHLQRRDMNTRGGTRLLVV
ncbi:hypothetical protein N1851_022237 [Merluccius polli]|uniref:Immunoglobulin domain-containing protein n=1 Tax=Merluccius polli TaxID=89951 RepID=A0AA47MI59_MERPO|nr:hypothetical protein N1851_022237 [Merluccius polli]